MRIVVIGAGPGGMAAALKAVELGGTLTEVTIIDNRGNFELGGVCLHEGCIPIKQLLTYGTELQKAKKFLGEVSRSSRPNWADWLEAQKAKRAVIERFSKQVRLRFPANGIEVIHGSAKFLEGELISVKTVLGEKILLPDKVIIATGSKPKMLKNAEARDFLDTTKALELEAVPQSINIIGGGVSGLEFATLFHLFGARVSIIEQEATLLPGFDERIARQITMYLKASGINVICGAKDFNSAPQTEKTLLCVGRTPNSEDLGLENTKVKVNGKGFILANQNMETTAPGIYAIGDVAGRFFLANTARKEGIIAARNALGQKVEIDYSNMPQVVWTIPQIATVGLTEKEAKEKGICTRVIQRWFKANPMSHILGETTGFIQIVKARINDEIIGCQIIGTQASELIHRYSGDNFFHPSLTEIFQEEAQ